VSILIGLLIGLILGLTGAGGSIFTVPLLILLLDLPINDAIGIALRMAIREFNTTACTSVF